jgi:hypothetical protein
MYRESDLMDCLFGLAGWRQTQNPELEQLTPALTTSVTGLYYQEAHPLVNQENLDQALKNYDSYVYPAYTTAAAYAIGNRIRYAGDGKVYEATAVIASAPSTLDPTKWSEVKHFSQKLEALTRSAINKVAAAMVTQKKLDGVTKSIFENIQLFGGVGDLMNKEVKQGRFVGFEIHLKSYRDVAVLIKRIGTQFSLANPAFKLWIFNSSQDTPIGSVDLNLTGANSFGWSASEVILKYLNAQAIPGGAYYIGYYEDDLVGNAINKGYSFGSVPACGSCSNDLYLYDRWSQFVAVMPFYVPAAYLEDKLPGDPGGPLLWNLNANQYTPSINYGLNLDLTTACDITDFLCREKRLFTDAIIKQVGVDVLNEIAYNTRNNVLSRETRELAAYALNEKENSDALPKKLQKAIDALNFDFTDLGDLCFPCNNNNGPTYSAF